MPASAQDLILVCFAVKQEAQFFRHSPGSLRANVCFTGMGPENAASTLRSILDENHPRFVITSGFAGGLSPNLARGSIVFESEDAEIATRLENLGAKPARFHCLPRVLITAKEKRLLWQQTGADIVEMESEIIRDICREQNVPSVAVRVILDTSEEDLPLDFNALLNQRGRMNYLKLFGHLAASPGKIGSLLRLRKHSIEAARKLGDVLTTLLAGMQETPR